MTGDGGFKHGPGGYRHHECRCDVCTSAARESAASRRRERLALTAAGKIPASVEHGRPSTYTNWGCHCDDCVAAWTEYDAGRRRRRREGGR